MGCTPDNQFRNGLLVGGLMLFFDGYWPNYVKRGKRETGKRYNCRASESGP